VESELTAYGRPGEHFGNYSCLTGGSRAGKPISGFAAEKAPNRSIESSTQTETNVDGKSAAISSSKLY
jgi:hypothetical protein